jgi:hypothetical protein
MIKSVKVLGVAAMLLVALSAQAKPGFDVRPTKGRPADDTARSAHPSACDSSQSCDETLEWSWGTSNAQSLTVSSADFAPAKGEPFSVCSSSACDGSSAADQSARTGKTGHVTINRRTVAPSSGPGSLVLRSNLPIVTKDVDNVSDTATSQPFRCAAGKHFKDAKLTLKRGDGGTDFSLDEVAISSCDSNSVTLSYQNMKQHEYVGHVTLIK